MVPQKLKHRVTQQSHFWLMDAQKDQKQRLEAFAHLCSQPRLLSGQKVSAARVHPQRMDKQRGPSRQWDVTEP